MSDLTDADLVAIADGISGASRAEYAGMASELLNLRAVVAAHPTGPDQDQPAAWLLVGSRYDGGDAVTTTREWAETYESGGGTAVPLVRARGAMTAAPPDDDEWVALYESARLMFTDSEPAPPARHEDEPAAEPNRTGWCQPCQPGGNDLCCYGPSYCTRSAERIATRAAARRPGQQDGAHA